MRIAFVGKGGSGKSTISSLFARHSARRGHVLAIDLDYNMDLAFNLGLRDDLGDRTIAQSRRDFFRYTGLGPDGALKELIARDPTTLFFDPDDPTDTYSARYAIPLDDRTKLMVVGPTPPDRLYGKECGHVFMSPIRYYLPFLRTDRTVILDSTAGTDLVSFGMYHGADVLICVVEPRPNALRVFDQIKPIAAEFHVPLYMFVNKDTAATDDLFAPYADHIIGRLPFGEVDTIDDLPQIADLYDRLHRLTCDPVLRRTRLAQWKDGHDAINR